MTRAKRSLRHAIDAKCRECIYDPIGGLGTWRQQVEGCTVKSCPLWAHRPVSGAIRPHPKGSCKGKREVGQ